MYQLGLVTQFEAAHHLEGPFGPAARLHGHTYRVEVAVEGERLGLEGALYDLGALQQHVRAVVDPLHYQNLDDLPSFAGGTSTLERIAEHVAIRLAGLVEHAGLRAVSVRVWESPEVFAGFRAAVNSLPQADD